MANISNALFEFTSELVEAAGSESALFQKTIHADVYEEINIDTIRIDDLRQAKPVLTADNKIRKDNAIVNVYFIAKPETQSLPDRLAARQRSEDMADAWLLKVFADPKLGNRVCLVGDVAQFNDWIRPATVKMPVCVLRLQVNPR